MQYSLSKLRIKQVNLLQKYYLAVDFKSQVIYTKCIELGNTKEIINEKNKDSSNDRTKLGK